MLTVKSFAIITENDKYLLICEAAKKWKGKWYFPGGKTNRGESPEDGAVRESKEEAGCDIKITGIFHSLYFNNAKGNQLHLFYHAVPLSSKIKQMPDEESLEAKWFTYDEILQLQLRQYALDVLEVYNRQVLCKA